MYRDCKGMTMWGVAMAMGLIAFFTLLFLKLMPPYLENFKIQTALRGIASESGAGSRSRDELSRALQKRFDIDDVSRVDLRTDFIVQPRGQNGKLLRIEYEVVVPLVYNISALLQFENTAEAK